jgi:hypothetical protein
MARTKTTPRRLVTTRVLSRNTEWTPVASSIKSVSPAFRDAVESMMHTIFPEKDLSISSYGVVQMERAYHHLLHQLMNQKYMKPTIHEPLSMHKLETIYE